MKWKLFFDSSTGAGGLGEYVKKYGLMTSTVWDDIYKSATENKVSLWIDTDAERKEDHYVCIAFHRTLLYIEDLHNSSPETFSEAMQCARDTWETNTRPDRCVPPSKMKQFFYPRRVTRTTLMISGIPIDSDERLILEQSANGVSRSPAWYNDNIINAWFRLTQQETTDVLCLDSFVILQTNRRVINQHHIKRLLQQSKDMQWIACPINLPGHWVLAIYTIATNSWVLYDSMRSLTFSDAVVKDNLKSFQLGMYAKENLDLSICTTCAQQDDASSCGPFVCWYLERFIKDKPMDTVNILAFRKRVKRFFFSL